MDIKVEIHNDDLPVPSRDSRPKIRDLAPEIQEVLDQRDWLYKHRLQIFKAIKHWHEHGDLTITLTS
jgi:hypothetical protein